MLQTSPAELGKSSDQATALLQDASKYEILRLKEENDNHMRALTSQHEIMLKKMTDEIHALKENARVCAEVKKDLESKLDILNKTLEISRSEKRKLTDEVERLQIQKCKGPVDVSETLDFGTTVPIVQSNTADEPGSVTMTTAAEPGPVGQVAVKKLGSSTYYFVGFFLEIVNDFHIFSPGSAATRRVESAQNSSSLSEVADASEKGFSST